MISRDIHRTFPEYPLFAFEQVGSMVSVAMHSWHLRWQLLGGHLAGDVANFRLQLAEWQQVAAAYLAVENVDMQLPYTSNPPLLQGQQALFNVLKAYALHDIEVRAGGG